MSVSGGAPAVLGLYGFTGWFIGMQNTRIPMMVSLMQNVVNIIASLLLVFVGGMTVEGVALGGGYCPMVGIPDGMSVLSHLLSPVKQV